jgi:glycine cleavage system transcriptional repressor
MESQESAQYYAISIMSKDRVGIIADVSQKISQLNGNIADIRQSVLCGYFSMILIVAFPVDIAQSAIESKLAEINLSSGTALAIAVKPISETISLPTNTFPENTYVLTVTGLDRVGFVAAVTVFCAAKNINILDLSTTRKADQYIMILFIDLTQSQGVEVVRSELSRFSEMTGLRVALQHYNIFRAVNEINLPVV